MAFDFDLTLASRHLYFELSSAHNPRTEQEWVRAYDKEYTDKPEDVFGGEERVGRIRDMLQR